MKNLNPWDDLSEKFNGHKNITEIDPDAADNILLAWPPIIDLINNQFKGTKNITILDYGCGTGAFCEKIWSLGYKNVYGMDNSKGMIEKAEKNYGDHIKFINDTIENESFLKQVDVITGIMVFQFSRDIEKTFQKLVKILKLGGLLIFVVHSPQRVTTLLKNNSQLFTGFATTDKPTQGKIHLGNRSIPIFIRTANEYDVITKNLNLSKIFEFYAPFTDDFVKQYGAEALNVPHFLILAFKKN